MPAADNNTAASPDAGKITDEDIDRVRRQISVPKFAYNKPYNRVASSDGIAHFTFARGDGNSPYDSREYGAMTRVAFDSAWKLAERNIIRIMVWITDIRNIW